MWIGLQLKCCPLCPFARANNNSSVLLVDFLWHHREPDFLKKNQYEKCATDSPSRSQSGRCCLGSASRFYLDPASWPIRFCLAPPILAPPSNLLEYSYQAEIVSLTLSKCLGTDVIIGLWPTGDPQFQNHWPRGLNGPHIVRADILEMVRLVFRLSTIHKKGNSWSPEGIHFVNILEALLAFRTPKNIGIPAAKQCSHHLVSSPPFHLWGRIFICLSIWLSPICYHFFLDVWPRFCYRQNKKRFFPLPSLFPPSLSRSVSLAGHQEQTVQKKYYLIKQLVPAEFTPWKYGPVLEAKWDGGRLRSREMTLMLALKGIEQKV